MCYGYYNGYGMYDCCGIMQFAMGMNMIANFFNNLGHNNNNGCNTGFNNNPFLVGNLLSNPNANQNLVGDLLTGSGNAGVTATVPSNLVGDLLSGNTTPSTAYPGSAYLPGSFQFDGNIFADGNNSGLDPTGLSLYDLTSNPALYPYPSLPGVPLPESCLVDSSGLPAISTGAYADMLQSAMPMPQFQPITPRQQTPQQQTPQTNQGQPSASRQSQQLQSQAAPRFSQLTRPSAGSGVSLASPYNGTANDLNSKLGGQLSGKGQVFLDAQAKYGVNAGILASICIHESDNGKSNLARTKNNVGGVRYAGSTEFRRYDSVDDCIMHMAKFLKSGYLDKGLTSIAQVGAKYCPTNDPTDRAGMNAGWGRGVTNIYNRDFA